MCNKLDLSRVTGVSQGIFSQKARTSIFGWVFAQKRCYCNKL